MVITIEFLLLYEMWKKNMTLAQRRSILTFGNAINRHWAVLGAAKMHLNCETAQYRWHLNFEESAFNHKLHRLSLFTLHSVDKDGIARNRSGLKCNQFAKNKYCNLSISNEMQASFRPGEWKCDDASEFVVANRVHYIHNCIRKVWQLISRPSNKINLWFIMNKKKNSDYTIGWHSVHFVTHFFPDRTHVSAS